MSLDFLTPAPGVLAHSPMERCARAASARFEARDGWLVAVSYQRPPAATGWVDMSHLGKLDVAGAPEELDDAAWCGLGANRSLVVATPPVTRELSQRLGARAIDVTTAYAALAIVGPGAAEVLARQCALDLRPATTPAGALRPGSVARTPALVLKQAEDHFLVLFGAALGEYMWAVLGDAVEHLGGGPLGVDALAAGKAPAHA